MNPLAIDLTGVLAVSSADLVRSVVSGLALGSKYALIALGFVVVFRATGVINFANGAFVLVGAYMTYQFFQGWEYNFYLSILLSMGVGFLLGVLLEALILRRLVGEAPFTVIMVTIGLLFVIDNVATSIWGVNPLTLGDPWTGNTLTVGDYSFAHRDLWAMGITAVVLLGFLLFFRYSTMGLAMRATALDPEAALAQGISARRVYRAAWGIAGLIAALAGTTLAAGMSINPELGLITLAAFPAMILGGMNSPLGAVIGGLVIGVVQELTQLYAPIYFEWAGTSVEAVVPYVVMVIILMVRPYGLFGTPEVRRV